MRLRLVSSPSGNRFMRELLEALAGEVPDGVDCAVVEGFGPVEDGVCWAWVPHEFLGTRPAAEHPSPAQLARTVAIHTEQPGSVWSATAIDAAASCGAVVDISRVGQVELARNGLRAELVQLGWCARWDTVGGDLTGARAVDVAWLASANRRRDVWLSAALPWIEPHESRLVCAPVAPKSEPGPAFLAGEEKLRLLASSKLLLNVRSQIPPYFEWVRALEAICNGCVYVTEHGAGHAPLVAGEHFVGAAPQHLGAVCDALLNHPDRLAAVRDAAYAFVRAELPMRAGAATLCEVAASLLDRPAAPPEPANGDPRPAGGDDAPSRAPAAGADPLPGPRLPDFTDPAMEPAPGVVEEDAVVRRQLRERTLALRAAQRRLRAVELREQGVDPGAIDLLHDNPGGEDARVTVCIPLFDYEDRIGDALESVAAQTAAVRLLVLDDASTDRSAERARAWLAAHPGQPGTVLARRVNAGLPQTRNAMLERVTTPYALMLDADNALFPRAAERLTRALDADARAAFAFGPVAIERDGRPDGLLSHLPWLPDELREHNWIDALALLRVDAVRALGGFAEDDRLHGWEDYDLWCRVAETGGHAAHVPQPIGRYRRSGGSMLSLSDLDQPTTRAALAERHPRLFAAGM